MRAISKAKGAIVETIGLICHRFLLGVVLNEDGFSVHFEIFDGNIQDRKTVVDVAKKVKDRFKIDKAIFVGDRVMISVENIKSSFIYKMREVFG